MYLDLLQNAIQPALIIIVQVIIKLPNINWRRTDILTRWTRKFALLFGWNISAGYYKDVHSNGLLFRLIYVLKTSPGTLEDLIERMVKVCCDASTPKCCRMCENDFQVFYYNLWTLVDNVFNPYEKYRESKDLFVKVLLDS